MAFAPSPHAPVSPEFVISATNPYDFQESLGQSSSSGSLPHEIIEELRLTRPWVRFIGILMMILVVLMVIGGGFILLGGLFMGGGGGGGGVAGMALFGGMGLMYLVMAALYAYPSLKLLGYGKAIRELEESADLRDLAAALRHQRSFWRFVGIVAAIVLVLYIVFFAGLLLFSV